jgi:hypothetical protein
MRKALIRNRQPTVHKAPQALAILLHPISTSHSTAVSQPELSLWRALCADNGIAAGGQYGGQQGGFAAPAAQSPAGYGGQPPMSGVYGGPPSAGGYGRGQQPPNQPQWSQQAPQGQGFNNGFAGYQG